MFTYHTHCTFNDYESDIIFALEKFNFEQSIIKTLICLFVAQFDMFQKKFLKAINCGGLTLVQHGDMSNTERETCETFKSMQCLCYHTEYTFI